MVENSILDFPVSGTSVLLRCDLNVPIKNGEVLDDSRILASVDTIKYLLSANATVVICSHLGKPDKANLSQYSLERRVRWFVRN